MKENKGTGVTPTAPKKEQVEHKNIYSALSAFQGEMKPIEQSAEVKFNTKGGVPVHFRYAPLGKIMETINPILAKHGLSVRHEIGDKSVECILTHATTEQRADRNGELLIIKGNKEKELYGLLTTNELRSGKLLVDLTKPDMKEVGGQITYGRRYTLGLVLGLATEEDKDTQLMDTARKNVADFAFKQARNTLEKAQGEELKKQVEFLKKELQVAQDLAAGTGSRAPALGLQVKQYEVLLALAEGKIKVGDHFNNPHPNPENKTV